MMEIFEIYDGLKLLTEQLFNSKNSWNGTKGDADSHGYPWNTSPPGAIPFDEQLAIPIPTVGAGFVSVVSRQVPTGMDGVITAYSCNYTGGGFIEGSGDIVWRLTSDGKPVKNYDNIITERGEPNLPRSLEHLRVYSNRQITFWVNHVANTTLSNGYIICGFQGYYYPSTE